MINPLNQQNGIIMYSNGSNIHRQPVCCAVIPSSFGVPLVLTSWIALSLYFGSLAFLNRSPFYSHYENAANIVFGALNILFVVVCLFGYNLHLIKRTLGRYRQYAKLLACCVATILLDMLINFIIFCVKKNDFLSKCQDSARNNLGQHLPENNGFLDRDIPDSIIIFNCTRLFNVEALFSFSCFVLMVMVYTYWASFIIEISMNFVLMRPVIQIHQRRNPNNRQHLGGLRPGFQQPIIPIIPVVQESPKGIILSDSSAPPL